VPAPKQDGSFEIKSYDWKPNFEGKIVDSIGHLHDGGIAVRTLLGPGNEICRSTTKYSESPRFVFQGATNGPDKAAKDHISSMTSCRQSWGEKELWLNKSMSVSLRGEYDYGKWPGNLEGGKQGEIMAITMLPVTVPREGAPKPSSGFFF
jgi:hypothetical protein